MSQPGIPVLESIRHSDGYAAVVRWWLPERPRGAVLYLHGIQSHGGWYEGSGAYLASRGLAVLMPDRRGSGLNAESRGHAESDERLMRDGRELIDELRRRTGLASVHVVGVSWGGKWGAALASTGAEGIATLSLVAPGLYSRLDLPVTEKMRIAWSLLTEPQRPFPLPLNEPQLFTQNPERLAFLEGDRLRLMEATASFLLASRRLDRPARRLGESGWRGGLHVMLAGADQIIDNARVKDFVRSLALPDSRIMEYEGAQHTLEFERDPRPYWNDLATWIVERC